jgi:hypothetical protein
MSRTSLANLSKPTTSEEYKDAEFARTKKYKKKPTRPKYGGRKKGSLNRITIEKRRTIEKELLARQQMMKIEGKKLAVEHMDEALAWIREAMATIDPLSEGRLSRDEGSADLKLFIELIHLLHDFSVARAPYQTPRLTAMTIVPPQRQRTMVNVTILNDRGEKIYSDAPNGDDANLIESHDDAA